MVDGASLELSMEYAPGDRIVHAEVDGEEISVRIETTRTGLKMTTRGASRPNCAAYPGRASVWMDQERPKGTRSKAWRNASARGASPSASVLKNRRVVFNIKGNDYRLIVAVAYKLQIVYVKFVGTHKEYDAVDAETVEMA